MKGFNSLSFEEKIALLDANIKKILTMLSYIIKEQMFIIKTKIQKKLCLIFKKQFH